METEKISLEYKYYSLDEIFEKVNIINNFTNIDYIVLWFVIIFSILLVLYVWPIIKAMIEYYKIKIQKSIKKKNLKKILLQKELEDTIEKELHI